MRILINNQQNFRRLNNPRIKKAARKILSVLKHPTAELSLLFVDDERMQQLNTIYRGIDRTTDVLSFPQVEFGIQNLKLNASRITPACSVGRHHASLLLGDIVINVPKAVAQARMSGIGFYDEISRLLIHGTLHLLGHDHEKSRHNAMVMMKKEKEIVDAFEKMA